MKHELLDGLVKVFLAALAIGISSLGLYSQLWIVDFFKRKAHNRREASRAGDNGEVVRARLRPNGIFQSGNGKDIDGHEDHESTDSHVRRKRVRSRDTPTK
jgi:hypothetical protein